MKVSDIMTRMPASCTPETNVGAAVEILWNRNCGMLPLVNAEREVVGVVTDRDLCIALGTRNRLPGDITVGEIASGKVYSCKSNDNIGAALTTMAQLKVRRLPVLNAQGKLEGILSMDDIVAHAQAKSPGRVPELSYEDVVETLRKLYQTVMAKEKTAGA